MNIIIDPYFLGMTEEDEIKRNLPSFQTLISLCAARKVNVYLYKELFERILEREVKPFPINPWKISDSKLRSAIINLNQAFSNVVMYNVKPIDIEECGGEQHFQIISLDDEVARQLESDTRYYELISVLLQPCYNEDLLLSECIVTGETEKGRKIGDSFTIVCACKKNYESTFRCGTIDEFQSDKDRALIRLRMLEKDNCLLFVKSPEITRGEHHNKLQKNTNYSSFEGLSRPNKSVLSLLRYFGLRKVIFGRFHEDSSYTKGTIISDDISITPDGDIVKGWLYAETGYRNRVDLYFPPEVGVNLKIYLDNEFSTLRVERLKELVLL